jgi:hypothetical protein
MKSMTTEITDTPRTDAIEFRHCPPQPKELLKKHQDAYALSRELERELNASQAEIERLQTLPESRHKAFLDLLERAEKAEAEVKEIRNALGDDGRRTHKEILEMAFKASGWKLWKEKYIDLRNAHIAEGQDPAGTIWEHADKLQKELKASQAENQKLRARLNQVQGCDCDNYLQTYCDKHNPHINP